MACQFTILPDRGLIYVRYTGVAGTAETIAAMRDCAHHPDFRPEYRHLVDFSRVTGFDMDYAAIIKMQVVAAESFLSPGTLPAIIYFAPTPESQRMAQIALRSWEGVTPFVGVIVAERAQVFDVLGITDPALDELIREAT